MAPCRNRHSFQGKYFNEFCVLRASLQVEGKHGLFVENKAVACGESVDATGRIIDRGLAALFGHTAAGS